MRIRNSLLAGTFVACAFARSATAIGIDLSWNDCSIYGTQNQTFDCATNQGRPFAMIASFVPPANVDHFIGLTAEIRFDSGSATFPDWWKFGVTRCREHGISVSLDSIGTEGNCQDPYPNRDAA